MFMFEAVFRRRYIGRFMVAKVKGHGSSEFAGDNGGRCTVPVYLELLSVALRTLVQWKKLYALGLRRSVYRKKTNVSKDFIGWDDLGFGW